MRGVELWPVNQLIHIEGYSQKRVDWLLEKVIREKEWTVPLKIEIEHSLVMDGQHRMEVAKKLGLKNVPVVRLSYEEVEVWSLRDNHLVDSQSIISRSLSGDIYPYKTAKHSFPTWAEVSCKFGLDQLGFSGDTK